MIPRAVSFRHETPSLILWEIVETLVGTVYPEYDPSAVPD